MSDRVDAQERHFAGQAAASNPEFWRRFGKRPTFAGRRVLDIGCGHGALSLEMAREGADVLAVDINRELVGWAGRHVTPRARPGGVSFAIPSVEAARPPRRVSPGGL